MNKRKKGGRPSKYETEWKDKLAVIQGWARDGLIDEQIAKNMGIHPATLYEWKKKYPEFAEALKKGKEVVDREVENALLKRALGYKYAKVTRERAIKINPETGESEEKLVVTKEVTKEVAPDVTALIFWLKNRKPDIWRDRHNVEHEGSLEVKSDVFRKIEQQLEQDSESRELLKQFFRRIRSNSNVGADTSES